MSRKLKVVLRELAVWPVFGVLLAIFGLCVAIDWIDWKFVKRRKERFEWKR